MKKIGRVIAVFAAVGLLAGPAIADNHYPPTNGEVRKVDPSAKKITIRHGPIEKLDMPAMTMVFQVEDPALLERVKPGDKVRFEADKVKGAYVIKRLEPAR